MSFVDPGVCGGCLSRDRSLQALAGDAAAYYSEIIATVRMMAKLQQQVVCWECAAEVRRAVRVRQRMRRAASVLLTHSVQQQLNHPSLSHLSSVIQTQVQSISYEDSEQFDKENDCEIVENKLGEDEIGSVFVKVEDDTSNEYLDENCDVRDIQENKDDFVSSDEEPLTMKKNKKARDTKKKKRRRVSAGAAALAALGVPPGAATRVLLTWEQVEEERQRALRSERYTRHSLRCEPCALGFNHSSKLRRHMLKHSTESGPLSCSACGVRCRTERALAAHRRRHRLRWRCAECGALSSRAAVAADHAAREHLAAPPAHACPRCPHVATSLGKLRSHLKEHGERARCELCGKSLRDRASLRTHLFIHRGEKEHACPECGKRFLFARALQLHRDTHARPAPLYCHQCDVAFKNRMSYYQHMRYNLKHVHPDKLKHACGECGARFVRGARLAEHRAARHTHDKPQRCNTPKCTFACASSAALRAHKRARHGAGAGDRAAAPRRRLQCHACGKSYTTKKSLETHEARHALSAEMTRTQRAGDKTT